MKRLLIAAIATCAVVCANAQGAGADAADPLYAALGGSTGLAQLMDDFVPRLVADERIGSYFKDTNLKELKKQLADQFCVVAGGPCRYEGDTMKAAHASMKIDKAAFNRLVEVLQVSMDERGIPFAEQNRLLARLAPMHRDVVNVR